MLEEVVKPKKQWIGFVVLLVILAVSVLSVYYFAKIYFVPKPNSTNQPNIEKKFPRITDVSSNILFTGNIFWGRYINDWSMASELKYAYPFSRLNEFDREKYDAWVSGLECPIVAGVNMTSAEMEAELKFNCSPDYLPEAAKWFTVVSLANNHTDNQGEEVGLAETRIHLEKSGIQHFGHYDPRATDDICEVIGLPVTIKYSDKKTITGKLPVAMCGHHGVFRIPDEASVTVMAQYGEYMPVIAMPHMGAEYQSNSDEIRTNFYRSLIDGGADMVLGDHPHWIQNTESYNGHLIVYSMGNFIFDQQSDSERTRSAAIRVVMNIGKIDSELLEKWFLVGEKCVTYKDNCLELIQQQKLEKLPINYQFGVVGSNNAGKITKPSTPEQLDAILYRLNWRSVVQQLKSPYSSL